MDVRFLAFTLSAGCSVALALAAHDARAMGAIVTSPPGASATTDLRIAVSAGARTTRWASLHVQGSATSFAWILPVRTGASLDLASDAWLEALDAATALRVLPPYAPPACGAPPAPHAVEIDGDISHAPTVAPDAVSVAADRATLDATLSAWGMALGSDLGADVDAVTAGDSFVVLRFDHPLADVITRTVRVVDDGPASLPLGLTNAGSRPVSITAFGFTDGAGRVGASSTPGVDVTAILWNADGSSTYPVARDAWLASHAGAWTLETSGNGPLFLTTPARQADVIPSLSATYFSRAAAYADATGAPATCTASATAWASSGSPVAPACPAGLLARVGASCAEVVPTGELAPDDFRCGGVADDLALALSGLAPGRAWITRARSDLAPGAFGEDTTVQTGGGASQGPVVTASGYSVVCGPSPSGSSGGSSGSGGSGGGSGGGRGGGSGGGGGAHGGGGTGSYGAGGGGAAADVGAAAASDSGSGGCGGDTSSDPDSGDSCSGDTSSTPDPSGSSSSSSDSCSGSGTGSSSSTDSSSNCAVSGAGSGMHVMRRSPASRLLLLLVALGAMLRQRARRAARA